MPNGWGVRLLDAAKQVHDIVGAAESAIRQELTATAEVVLLTFDPWLAANRQRIPIG